MIPQIPWDLIHIYRWTIVAGITFGGALSFLGSHLAARDKSMQTLCLGQGAMLGVLFALGVIEGLSEHGGAGTMIGPFAAAFLFSGATFLFTEAGARKHQASKSTFFSAVFAVLLAASYLVSAFFPALEHHMAQVYFGDLATLSEFDSITTAVIGVGSLLFLTWKRHTIANQSFESAIFGNSYLSESSRKGNLVFNTLALLILCFSVQFLGFLFTVTCLFLPTMLFQTAFRVGLRRHLVLCFTSATLGTLLGFLLSLTFTRFPTVPTIAISVLGLGVFYRLGNTAIRKLIQLF